jgi:uncharacterized protein
MTTSAAGNACVPYARCRPRVSAVTRESVVRIAWRRLDVPGHERAELWRTADGWRLSELVTLDGAAPARIDYALACDVSWRPARCALRGTSASSPVMMDIARDPCGSWIANVCAAWVRFPELTIEPLEQRYTRLAAHRYLYESTGGTFRRELTVDDHGFVIDYPGLWIAQPRHET